MSISRKIVGPKLYLQQRKRSTIRNTFLGFLPPLTTSCEDFQQTETIVSQLKKTLGHLRLWQSIARRWTQRLRLFERHMIGEEIELFRYVQRNGYYPLFKGTFESMIFRFARVGYVIASLFGMCKVPSMRGMVIPLVLCVMEDCSRDFFQRNWNATQNGQWILQIVMVRPVEGGPLPVISGVKAPLMAVRTPGKPY